MANKIRLARGTKARIETIKETLSNYELVYSMDTHELGVKNSDGTITYFGVVTELEWANILNKPTFAAVATSGAYADLTGKPDLDLKLDKDFSALPNQATPLLTDVMVINRGATIQRTTLGALLALVDTEIFIVVATLPATGLANKIYLIPHTAGGNQNDYEEYIWVNNKWENIGKFSIDLSNYYNKGQVDGLLGAKVNANNPITAGTHPKITYDAKGLVTGGSDLVASDIPPLAISKVTNLQSSLDNKVDKVEGKGLSTNDYTDAEKDKLSGIQAGAQKNVVSNWNATSGDGLILNKPVIPNKVSDLTNDSGYITGYTETDPIFTAWNKSTGISITKSQVSDLIEATQSLSGLMSATDKQRLDVLHAILEEDTANNVVDSINEVLAIFNNYPEGADLVTVLSGKVDKITGKGLSTNDLTNALKSNYDTAYTHSQSAHAPSNAQKNSDITKAEIEAKLTGEISSHSHALPAHTHTKSQITDFPTSMPPTAHSTDLLTSGTLGIARGGTGRTDGYAVGVVETRASVLTKIWTGTQAQYDAIGTKDANTLYFII